MPSSRSGSGGRRSRGQVPREPAFKVKLLPAEKAAVRAAAARAGLAPGAFAAQAVVDVAEDWVRPGPAVRRELQAELTDLVHLVYRAGVNLNQAVAGLNATGRPGPDLKPAAEFCMRTVRRVDETIELLRRDLL
jgi:hypothetical protein